MHDETAGLYNLAVLPECRKQGIGTVLHSARLAYGAESGYMHATLQASPMATTLDKSLGFDTLSEISVYRC